MDIKDLLKITNKDDLNKYGSIEDAVNCINQNITPLKADAKTIKKKKKVLELLKTHWDIFSISEIPYFKDEKSKFIFALTELDGTNRNKLIGLTEDLYSNTEKAKSWYRNIVKQIHPDTNGSTSDSKKAFEQLEIIFARITKANSSMDKKYENKRK